MNWRGILLGMGIPNSRMDEAPEKSAHDTNPNNTPYRQITQQKIYHIFFSHLYQTKFPKNTFADPPKAMCGTI